jgi:hypothetical protein
MMLGLPAVNLVCDHVVVTRRETMSEVYGVTQPVSNGCTSCLQTWACIVM